MSKSSKAPKKSSGSKADIKATAIVVGIFFIVVLMFMYFKKDKNPPQSNVKPPAKGVIKPEGPKKLIPVPVKEKPTVKLPPGSAGKIAFVIDDWGQSLHNCKYLKEIKEPIAIAVLPELRNTQSIIKCAQTAENKVIMLHMPMEPYKNSDPYPTNYIIKTSMKAVLVEKTVQKYFQEMPQIEGFNNHMGSKATEDRPLMTTILKQARRKGLFYIDSMTAPKGSVAWRVADELHMPYAKRDVFLDNINTREEILKQFSSLITKAKKRGVAIAIGHDRELTMQMIKEQIPVLEGLGFEIVSVKELLKNKR